jgi:predicted ATP-binding protein involved in virulence
VRLALERFLSAFNDDIAGLKVKRSSSRENEKSSYSWNELTDIVIQKAGQELSLTQLSSGERALILLVADIARRASILNENLSDPNDCKGIVLIDEVELHLHPKWQRSAVPALQETFPNIYFVIATHSPQVLSHVEKGSVFEVENFQLMPRQTYGRDNQWILEAVMDDEERPVEIQEKLEKYFNLIREGDIKKANEVRVWLEEKIGSDEPEFTKADILIRRKEKAALQ